VGDGRLVKERGILENFHSSKIDIKNKQCPQITHLDATSQFMSSINQHQREIYA
jgi:hypothetical protein